MKKIPSIDKISKLNKNVDTEKLLEGMKLFKELRKLGGARLAPRLASPLSRRKASLSFEAH